MKIGLKLWTSNTGLAAVARELCAQKICDFLELYAVPGFTSEETAVWRGLDIPYVIHAPHFWHGLNLSLEEKFESNRELLRQAKDLCAAVNGSAIIVHLGTRGTLAESIRQFNLLKNSKMIVENKPQISVDETQCVGTSPADIAEVMRLCGVGFCLDIPHAIAFCAFHHKNWREVVADFLRLAPVHYHLCDGFKEDVKDEHYNLGAGDFDLKTILSLLPRNAAVTLETPKSLENLDRFVEEAAMLRCLVSEGEVKIETGRFWLKPLRLEDVGDRYLSWFADRQAQEFILYSKKSQTLESLQKYVAERIGREDVLFLGIFTKEGGEHIGNIKYEPVNAREGFAEMGILIGEAAWRGRGVAGEVLRASAAWLKKERGIRKIFLGVEGENQAALKVYEKVGFRRGRVSGMSESPPGTIDMVWEL